MWRHGLRGRATLGFVAVALLLSVTVAVTVWLSVSGYLLQQRQKAAFAEVAEHIDQLAPQLQQGVSARELLGQLPREAGSTSLLRQGDEWYASSLQVDRSRLPAALREAVADGQPSYQRYELDEVPVLAVGVPLSYGDNDYYEVFVLEELDRTFTVLSTVLTGSVLVLPLGALLLGGWALRQALRPLDRVVAAAEAIASGDLGARLDASGDPGLTAIAASFNETAAALEQRVRADAHFAADVSHELRSPLTTMMNAVSLLEGQRERLPPAAREVLDLLGLEVVRFDQLVDDLLEISRSDAGSANLNLQVVRLADLVERAVPAHLGSRLELTAAGAEAVVCVDKRRLERVVANLVDNAQRHGGGLDRVTIDADGRRATVQVEDAGPGLDETELHRIFERFARGRGSGRDTTSGAGLGLSLVARHVHLLDGTVTAGNRPQGGARFVVTIPTREEKPCPD